MLVDPGGDSRNERHEGRRLRHEVIRRKDRDDRVGILACDPVDREEDPRGGPPVRWLDEHTRRLRTGPLLAEETGMAAQRDHRGLAGTDLERHAIQGLAQQGSIPENGHVLLRSLLTADPTGQSPQPHPLASGQHDAPQMRFDLHLALLPSVPISARTPTSPASCVDTGLCKGQAECARTAKGVE